MTNEEKVLVEKLLESERLGFAYLHPNGNGQREEYVFDMTPENIANFVGKHQYDASKMVLTDMLDVLILDTMGGFINTCLDKNLLEEVKETLIPIQMGEQKAADILMVTSAVLYEYGDLEDQKVTETELKMM